MAKLTAFTKNTSGLNSGVEQVVIKVPVNEITTDPIFQSLLPINQTDLEEITKNMKEHGFEKTKAVCVWKEKGILIDGYTRLTAAKAAGLLEIYKYEKSFETEEDALQYAVEQQLNRRNLNDAGKIILIEKLDNLKRAGRPGNEETAEEKGKSAEKLAKAIGTSTRSVERTRSVLKNGDEELISKVKSGEVSINKASEEIKKKKKEQENSQLSSITEPILDTGSYPVQEEDAIQTTSSFPEIDFEETEPYEEKISMYEEIIQMDLHHLAVFLFECQSENLTVSEWEEKLRGKDKFYSWK